MDREGMTAASPARGMRILLLARLLIVATFVVAILSWLFATSAVFFAGEFRPGMIRAIAVDGLALAALAVASGWLAQKLEGAQQELFRTNAAMDRLSAVHAALATGLECGVVVLDGVGQIRSANPAAQRILGCPTQELLGRRLTSLVPLLLRGQPDAGGFQDCEQRLPSGQSRKLHIRRVPLDNSAIRSGGEVVVLQELSAEPIVAGAAALSLPLSENNLQAQKDFLVGDGSGMQEVRRLIGKVAAAPATVLITGESGTGKELVAQAIHAASERASGPFVVVNCGAIPEGLMESELFGHIRGAFTGAESHRTGLFRQAQGGTLFLDEVGELTQALQVRLLRVLQEKVVTPVGGKNPVSLDVRVLAATNRSLEAEVRAERFRQDLFYRLAVITIEIPPLRERMEDLPALLEHFLQQAVLRHRRAIRGIDREAMQCLQGGRYPGNVRELKNIVEYAVTLAESEELTREDLPEALRKIAGTPDPEEIAPHATLVAEVPVGGGDQTRQDLLDFASRISESLDERLARTERDLILEALDRASGVKKHAAALLGVNYRSLRHRLQKHGIAGRSGRARF
ncbi:MAG: sigma 54-interacting transcriptional regulator [Candidatus Binatia bacterium]|nr:sigma 54-interacting transcriptional regulator [Candidatus Binatia bacterium]